MGISSYVIVMNDDYDNLWISSCVSDNDMGMMLVV